MSARGIIGNKPIQRADATASDVINLRTQFEATLTNAVPLAYGRSGGFIIYHGAAAERPFIYFSKESNGKYYPRSSFTYYGPTGSTPGSASYGTASYGAAWVATLWNTGPSYIRIYKRSTGGLADFEYVTQIHMLSDNSGDAVGAKLKFSNDGVYLLAAAQSLVTATTYKALRMYKRTGDSFSELTIPQPDTTVTTAYLDIGQVGWNNDASSFAVYSSRSFNGTSAGSLQVAVYNRSGDTFTKVWTYNTGTKVVASLFWSNSGNSLYIIYNSSSGWEVYNRSGDTFTAVTGLPTLPDLGHSGTSSGRQNGASINSTDDLIALPRYASADSTICRTALYSRTGDTFTLVSYFAISGVAATSPNGVHALFLNDSELIVNTVNRPMILDVTGTTLSHPYAPKIGEIPNYRLFTGTVPYLGNGFESTLASIGYSTAAVWNLSPTNSTHIEAV